MERGIQLMVTLPSALLVAICIVMIVHRMIDGEFPVVQGIIGIGVLAMTLFYCVWPPHPAFPYVAWIAILSLMLTFPYAQTQLVKVQMREIDVSKLEKAQAALEQRPDNFAAAFEVAKQLYGFGFVQEAIAIGDQTMAILATRVDPIRNISFKDSFRPEIILLDRWKRTPAPPPPPGGGRCGACRTENPLGTVVCKGCGKPYLLEKVRAINPAKKFAAKLFLTWILLGVVIIAGAGIGLALGPAGIPVILVVLVIIGLLLHFLFRIPNAGSPMKEAPPLYQREG
jgi:hypothetical protein